MDDLEKFLSHLLFDFLFFESWGFGCFTEFSILSFQLARRNLLAVEMANIVLNGKSGSPISLESMFRSNAFLKAGKSFTQNSPISFSHLVVDWTQFDVHFINSASGDFWYLRKHSFFRLKTFSWVSYVIVSIHEDSFVKPKVFFFVEKSDSVKEYQFCKKATISHGAKKLF